MAVILLYHGVTDLKSEGIENYSGKHINADLFYKQMTHLNREHVVMSLESWLENRREDAVIITFDDTYENVFVNAVPILHEYRMPATWYVCAGMVNTSLMYWTDIVECCLNYTARPAVMGYPTRTNEERLAAAIVLKDRGKKMGREDVRYYVGAIIAQTGVDPSADLCANYRNVTWEQLQEADCAGIDIGGHGLYHDILAYMEPDEQESEIFTTKGLIQTNLQGPVTQFSYPEGQDGHFNSYTIQSLKKAGFWSSPTAMDWNNNARTDPYHLGRVMVGFNGAPFPWVI